MASQGKVLLTRREAITAIRPKIAEGAQRREQPMSEMKVFRIIGISPLLTNNPASMKRADTGLGTKKIPTPDEEAAAKVYEDGNGFYILSESFRSAIIGSGGGASGRKIGKFSAASRVSAGMFTVEPHATLLDPQTLKPLTTYQVDTRRAVVQRQGVLRSRPMFAPWAVRLHVEIDTDFVTPNHILELLNIAGKVAGVGDFRPQRKGTFGRFKAELES
jgi:hypothetical protein